MISFFVVFNKVGKVGKSNIVGDTLKSLHDDYYSVFADDKIGIALESFEDSRYNSIDKKLLQSDHYYYDEETGCHVIADSRIDYKGELLEKLEIEWQVGKGYTDSKLIILAYFKWREYCVKYLYGDFSFVIWDPEENQILSARDQIGVKPLYYCDKPNSIVLASKSTVFKDIPDHIFEIREQYILDSICSIELDSEESAFQGISKLRPAHYLIFARAKSKQCRYWDLKVDKNFSKLTLEEAIHGLNERIFESVRQRCHLSGQIGVELSGGLDSSGIASVLATILGEDIPINAFTHAISNVGGDQHSYLKSELEYSKAITNEFSSIRQYILTEEESEGSYMALVGALGQMYKPINQSFSMNSDLLFKAAGKSGTIAVFSGLGGDEGITNNGRGYFNELISQGLHSKLRKTVKIIAKRGRGSVSKRVIKIYLNYYAPIIYKLRTNDWRKARFRSFAIDKLIARKYRMEQRFFETTSIKRNPDVRTVQYFRIKNPSIPDRIEETTLFAQYQGIEYRYPFLDVKLVEFFYALPSEYKHKDGYGRYLFRRSMEGVLPDKIRQRTDKTGITIPYVFVRLLKDEVFFREIIEESRKHNQFHYVDYDKIHGILDALVKMKESKKIEYGPREILSPISVLILQKWQREGKIDIGIKC